MKKSLIFILVLTFFLLSACSNSSVEESNAKKEQDIEVNEQKEIDSTEQANNTKSKKESEENPFIFQYNSLKLELDKSLKDSLVINDTNFFYSDQTLSNQDIMLGTITSMSLDEWNNDNWNGDYTLVYYDNQIVYIFNSFYDWPYSEDQFTSQYENYVYTFESLVKNLFSNGFHTTDLKLEQSILDEMDLNQKQYGIEVSRIMYQDLHNWYTTLKTSMKNEMSLEEKYQVISTIQQEVEQAYPELRQIPFPSIELGENIAKVIDLLKVWSESPYRAEKANHLNIDNQIEMIRLYLEVIDKQIMEIENS